MSNHDLEGATTIVAMFVDTLREPAGCQPGRMQSTRLPKAFSYLESSDYHES